MATILETTDFASGITKLALGQFSDLDTYITESLEDNFIRLVFGETLGNEFIADLTGSPRVPQDAKFITLFNELDFVYSELPLHTTGIKEILKYEVFVNFTSDQPVKSSTSGNQRISQEASEPDTFTKKATVMTNRNYESITNLQCYVLDNSDIYTNFNGYIPELASPL